MIALPLMPSLWEPRSRGDGGGLRGSIATGASLLQGQCPAFCGSPASGRLFVVCVGFRDGASLLQGECPAFCRNLDWGRLWVVCLAYRDGGVAPTGGILHFVGAPPRGDCGWFAWVIAMGASLLQGRGRLGSLPEPVAYGGQGDPGAEGEFGWGGLGFHQAHEALAEQRGQGGDQQHVGGGLWP